MCSPGIHACWDLKWNVCCWVNSVAVSDCGVYLRGNLGFSLFIGRRANRFLQGRGKHNNWEAICDSFLLFSWGLNQQQLVWRGHGESKPLAVVMVQWTLSANPPMEGECVRRETMQRKPSSPALSNVNLPEVCQTDSKQCKMVAWRQVLSSIYQMLSWKGGLKVLDNVLEDKPMNI